jgi:hypothetical protein
VSRRRQWRLTFYSPHKAHGQRRPSFSREWRTFFCVFLAGNDVGTYIGPGLEAPANRDKGVLPSSEEKDAFFLGVVAISTGKKREARGAKHEEQAVS